ncbi:hypothetical protein [Bradyrhizobium sp. CCBAU 45384]|uniref:hypothetical protein n=1 Tax=Bradyrhizobium sp. CCBAU 45384 TaxID=858428 RepID=UPI002306C9A7|nr:hypothetical protein [Bradyrhizobium sp. CCBAU 45384]MDA9406063.1 hypothetical protein [Bradyrhizobium sp. CCBAU 45384]
MPLHFRGSVTHMDIWSATTHGLSFVVSVESIDGPSFYDRPGYMARWRPLYESTGAIELDASPFTAFAEAEKALVCSEV